MSISDLIKNKFVEEFTAISVGTLLTTLLLSFVLGLFVLVIYRVTFGGVSFSKSFALSLVMLSMVTALAILTVRSNVVLSLGMVGALSIVRFRTAIKDPMDTVFMFWTCAQILALLRQYGLPTETDFCRDALADAARADKKIAGGALHLIVPERIGCCRIETVPAADIPAWLADGGIV